MQIYNIQSLITKITKIKTRIPAVFHGRDNLLLHSKPVGNPIWQLKGSKEGSALEVQMDHMVAGAPLKVSGGTYYLVSCVIINYKMIPLLVILAEVSFEVMSICLKQTCLQPY